MAANLVIHKDPFRPALNVETSKVKDGQTIWQTLVDSGFCTPLEHRIARNGPFIVLLNGELILEADWAVLLNEDDVVQVTRLPRGGGKGGSNVGNILGAIVIAVAAYFTFGLSLVATAAVGVGAFAALSLMTGAVPAPTTAIGSSGESPSPTYSLNAQGNIPRLLQAMPRIYGRVQTTPDFAALPYSEYEGNEQYLYQLFCISLGAVEIESITFDNTLIGNFPDAQYEIINPGGAVTLFPDNVVTSDAVTGQTLLAPNNPGYTIVGPYVAVPAGKTANFIAVDIAAPQGVGRIDDNGKTVSNSVEVSFEYQTIDDAGNAISAWLPLVTKTLTFATTQAQIITIKVPVTPARYQIRGRRFTNEVLDNRTYDTVQWTGLRSYLSSTYTYGNCTLLAVKARATNSLNSTTARRLQVVAIGKTSTWDPVNGWGPLVSNTSPAWAAADILMHPEYGRGLPTSRLNINKLYALAQTWQSRGDTFNGVFDSTSQLWESLSAVLRVGRCVPMYYAGVIDFIRDEPQSIPTASFQPGNIIAGSFKTTYNFFDVNTPDHVIINYRDSTTWEPAQVSCTLPGETALNPKTIDFFGCTSRDQAWREGMSMVAANRDRRRRISFSTLTEALVLKYNGLIRVSHDVPQWGFSGRVLSFNATAGILRTSEPVPFDISTTNVIAFRKKDGSEHGPFTMSRDSTIDEENGVFGCVVGGTLAQRQAIFISDGTRQDYTFYQCGPTEKCGIKALVMSITPDADGKVRVECINYADSVYSAENGGVVPPPGPESSLPTTPTNPIIDRVSVVYTVTVGEQNVIATPARGAIYYEFQAKLTGQSDWAILGNQDTPIMVVHLQAGNWSVRVRGIGRNPGPWTTWTGDIASTSLPTATLDTFVAAKALWAIDLSWTYSAASASLAKNVEIWAGLTNVLGNASRVANLPYPANKFTITNLVAAEGRYLWARVIDTAGRIGPWFNNGVPIYQIAEDSAAKILAYLTQQISDSQLTIALLDKIENPIVDFGPVYAAIDHEETQRINGDTALTTITTNQQTTINANSSAIAQEATTRSNADSTLTTQVNTAASTANAGLALAQTVQTTAANTNGDLAAMYNIKTQIDVNGRTYVASIGVGVSNTGGIIESQILLAASRFAIIDPNSGSLKVPFAYYNGAVYMNLAMIENASITTAKIGDAQITAAKIASANILTAHIADAQILTAKIADLSVNTLKIAGRSVTVPSLAFSNGLHDITGSTGNGVLNFVTTQSLTVAVPENTYASVNISFGQCGQAGLPQVGVGAWRLWHNGAIIATGDGVQQFGSTAACIAVTAIAGNNTFDLQVSPHAGTGVVAYGITVQTRAISFMAVMR
jgi:predicted phage tail protein